jgi:hypothetical protein
VTDASVAAENNARMGELARQRPPRTWLLALVAALALVLVARAGDATAAPVCAVHGAHTVAQDDQVRILFTTKGHGSLRYTRRYSACDRTTGRRQLLEVTHPRAFNYDASFSTADHWVLAGRWFAYRLAFDEGPDYEDTLMRGEVGARPRGLEDFTEDDTGAKLGRVVVDASGAAAWSLSVDLPSDTYTGSLVAGSVPGGDPVVLSCGAGVDARSLGLAFGVLSWTDGSGTHAVGFPGALANAPSEQTCRTAQ